MKCSSCGATIPDGSRKCIYCGESVPQTAAAAANSSAAGGSGNVFDTIRQSPQFLRASTAERLAAIAKPNVFMVAIPIVFLGVFLTIAFGIASSAARMGAGTTFVIAPIGMAIFGILVVGAIVQRFVKVWRAPLTPRAAVVKAKRTSVSGGENPSTSYHATFEFGDGSREEFEAPAELYSQLAEEDGGVLFTRANTVAAFDRVATA
jgi:uncharacterized protein DUF2500/zinc ribbon protein